ncbi:MFS transporter [Nocardia vermiculata]|uniref:MFS transporter n=1 Tax=Nocardia vermiculata TaxID=257274 RepID=A0A846XZ75_9NOCA|nr:MFS transporter [Nocardia vermiculata]NKY50984.1 MFS transporter [Nocardia vermiculata]
MTDRPTVDPGCADAHRDDRFAPPPTVGAGLAVLAVVLLGLDLRLVFGSASALISEIRRDYDLGAASVVLLTTGPVVCLGLFGALAARTVRRWTVPTVLTGCMLVVTAGTALRGIPAWSALLLGTLLAGIGIAVANVLGPVLIRLLFPHRIGIMTGLLTALVSASAGIASGATIPLKLHVTHGWHITLSIWAVPAAGAAAVLGIAASRFRRSRSRSEDTMHHAPHWRPEVLRSPTAWAITGFMGIQSLLAYSMIAWLPTIYRDRHLSAEQAGLLLTALSLASILTALLGPMVATRLQNQSILACAMVALSVAGLLGVLSNTGEPLIWAILLGLGQGGQLSLALTLVNVRAASAPIATSLSTMAQSIGYLIAAAGPILTGALHSATGSWTAALATLLGLMGPLAVCGWIAGLNTDAGTDRFRSSAQECCDGRPPTSGCSP